MPAGRLTIADRKGEFPGMLKERIINVVLVDHDHGTGLNITDRSDKVVNYSGKEVTVEVR